MINKKSFGKTLLTLATVSGMLLGAAGSASASFDNQEEVGTKCYSYAKAKKIWPKVYKLAFFENEAGDSDCQYWKLGWYRGGKLKQYTLDSNNNHWQEVVDPNLKTPYVVLDGDSVVVHRPPYNMYNQPAVSGTVTAKE